MRSPLTYSFATNIIANLRPKTRRGRLAALVISVALPCTVAFSASSAGLLGKLLFGRLSAERSAKSGRGVGGAMALGNVTLPPVQTTSDTSLSVARKGHTATLLTDGRVLIAGGENATGLVIQAAIFDPSAGTFSVTGNLNNSRADHSATRLADGRVLIAGGRSDLGALNTTEIFDPTSGTFTGGPNLNDARSGQSATVLGDGRIVLAGGDASGSVEIYDPQANAFTSLSANMSAPRAQHGAALLNDGRILFAGGAAPDGSPVRTGEVLDVVNASFAAVSNNTEDAHLRPLLRVLPDGKVQIIGGADHDDMEIYDEAANIFGAHVHVYPIGDEHPGLVQQILNSPVRAALFRNGVDDPLLDRSGETITELSGNQALVAGGVDSNGATLGSAAILSSSSATITTDKLDYPPGTPVIVSGSGWQANESVVVMLHEDPHINTENPHTFTVQADGNGNFSFQEYAPEDADLGVSYIAAAVGQSSGWTAQTGFHDGSIKMQIVPDTGTSTATITSHMTVTPFNDPNPNDGANACTSSYTAGATTVSNIDNSKTPASIGLGSNTYALLVADATASDGSAFKSWQNTSGATFNPGGLGLRYACVENVKSGTQTWNISYGGPTKVVFTNTAVNAVVNTCHTLTLQTQLPDGTPSSPNANQPIDLTSSSGTPTWYASSNGTCSGATTSVTIPSTANSVSFDYKDGTVGTPSITGTPTGSSMTPATQGETWVASCSNASVSTNPSPVTVTYGDSTATFTATGGGTPAPTVQWQVSTGGPFTNLSNSATYSGVTTGTLTITGPTVSLSGNQYRAVFTNTCNGTQTANSTGATLTVNKANLNVNAVANSKTYGASDPAIGYTLSGFQFTDTSGVACGTGSCTRAASNTVAGTPYTITYTAGTLSAANYNFVTGTTVNFTFNARNATW